MAKITFSPAEKLEIRKICMNIKNLKETNGYQPIEVEITKEATPYLALHAEIHQHNLDEFFEEMTNEIVKMLAELSENDKVDLQEQIDDDNTFDLLLEMLGANLDNNENQNIDKILNDYERHLRDEKIRLAKEKAKELSDTIMNTTANEAITSGLDLFKKTLDNFNSEIKPKVDKTVNQAKMSTKQMIDSTFNKSTKNQIIAHVSREEYALIIDLKNDYRGIENPIKRNLFYLVELLENQKYSQLKDSLFRQPSAFTNNQNLINFLSLLNGDIVIEFD